MTRVSRLSRAVPRIIAVTVAIGSLGTHNGTAAPVPSETPTSYVYLGNIIDLELDSERLAIQYRPGTTSAGRAGAWSAAGVGIASETPTGVEDWHLLNVDAPLVDPDDAYQRIEALLALPEVVFVSPVFHGDNGGWLAMTPDILLRFEPDYRGQGEALLAMLAPQAEVIAQEYAGMAGAFKVRSASRNGFLVLAEANALALDPRIAWAESDALFTGRSELIPNDPGFPSLWGIRNTGQYGGTPDMDMDGDLAWDITTGSSTVKVLIIDVGVEQTHPDLNQLPGADFTGEGGGGGPVNACDKHGTAVAGCVSAIINNSLGTVGIAPGCPSISARTFISSLSCDGSWTAQYSWTADALAWAEAQAVRVSNNSNYYGSSSSAVTTKYAETYANGMVHFASAGNSSQPSSAYPASLSTVNSVAALTPTGALASFSNYGSDLSLSAPGTTVYTTDRTGTEGYVPGDYVFVQGTSFASPYSAGVAALVLSQEPSLTPDQVEEKLHCTARDLGTPGFDHTYGYGFVNAHNALSQLWVDSDGDGAYDPCDNCPMVDNATQHDGDGDGIGDACDNCPATANPGQANADADTLGDACDNCPSVDNDNQANSDADDVGDACDNCPTTANANQANADADTLGDACDNCVFITNDDQADGDGDQVGDACDNCEGVANTDQADTDGDQRGDACDNCPTVPNPAQTNSDADTLGDACDNCTLVANDDQADADGDDVGDACDNCPAVPNLAQTNSDADTLGDACDNCALVANDDQTDGDGDDVGDACDNCAALPNPGQANADADTLGDACDNCALVANDDQADVDDDTVGDACDNCRLAANTDQLNSDADTLGDACDNCILHDNPDQLDTDGDAVGDACDNCPLDFNPDQEDTDGDEIGDVCDCMCDCHADPQCDAVTNALDVMLAVSVAFRSGDPIIDPNARCPYETTDVDCSGFTNVIDVVKFVNVGFRNRDPAIEFCVPCP